MSQDPKALLKTIESSFRFRLLRRIFPNRPQTVEISGQRVVIRPGTPDVKVAIQSFGTEFAPARDLLKPDFDGLIVDAGGYIGTAALQLARMFPKATVVSIEPSSSNFAILSRNVRGHANIRPVQAALVAQPSGPLVLSDRGTGAWGFTIVDRAADRPEMKTIEEVPTVTLPELCARFGFDRIGFLKLDIEGAEKALFEGDPAMSGMDRVESLMVELHDRIVPGCSEALQVFAKGREITKTTGDKWLMRGTLSGQPA